MPTKSNGRTLTLIGLVILPTTQPCVAITVELAERCTALTNKAFPWRSPDNPAAGRTNGSPKQARDYYDVCVAKNGSIGEPLHESDSSPRDSNGSGGESPSLPQRRTFPDGLL
jgi:hypothetical protein